MFTFAWEFKCGRSGQWCIETWNYGLEASIVEIRAERSEMETPLKRVMRGGSTKSVGHGPVQSIIQD